MYLVLRSSTWCRPLWLLRPFLRMTPLGSQLFDLSWVSNWSIFAFRVLLSSIITFIELTTGSVSFLIVSPTRHSIFEAVSFYKLSFNLLCVSVKSCNRFFDHFLISNRSGTFQKYVFSVPMQYFRLWKGFVLAQLNKKYSHSYNLLYLLANGCS